MGNLIEKPLDHFVDDSFLHDSNGNKLDVSTFIGLCPDLDKLPASQIAQLFVHVKSQLEFLEEHRKELSAFVELMKNVKIPEAFDREQIKTFTLQDGTRVTKTERTTCGVLDKARAVAWLQENGYEDVPQLTINAQTMGSVAKEILSNVPVPVKNAKGEITHYTEVSGPSDLPDDIFKVAITPSTSVTKGKG